MASHPPTKRRLWGSYIESSAPGKDGRPGIINDWLWFVLLFPFLLLFVVYCRFTTAEEPTIDR